MIPFGPRFPLSPFSPEGPVDNIMDYRHTFFIILIFLCGYLIINNQYFVVISAY